MYQVDQMVTVTDNPPTNGNGFVQVNPLATPSDSGTYAILVTGWSKPTKFDWDIVPNLLAKGTLYNAEAGVKLLLASIASNPLVDRVYLLALTRYDLVSQSFKAAYDALQGSGLAVSVTFDLPIEPLPLPKGTRQVPQYTPSSPGTDIYAQHQQALMQKIVSQGTHYPDRKFTALTNQIVTIVNPPRPDWQEYFTQWVSADPPSSSDVAYTYGSLIVPQLANLVPAPGCDQYSTQKVITLLGQYSNTTGVPAGKPCLTQLSYFDGELTATFRSHDVGQAWLLNTLALAYCFYQWFPTLDNRKLTIVSINAHVYDWDKPSGFGGFVCDPQGYFYFKVDPEGFYECYLNDTLVYTCGTKAALQRYISKNHPDLSTGHVFWLANAILTL